MEEIIQPTNQHRFIASKPKRWRKFFKFLIIFIIISAAIIYALGYLLPGFLWQKDLGVIYTSADYQSIMTKLNYTKDDTPTGASAGEYIYSYGPVSDIDIQISGEELTAFINTNRPSYYPLKNVQIKINSNDTIEASGSISTDYVLNIFFAGKFSEQAIADEIPALNLLPDFVNFSTNFSGSITNNLSDIIVNNLIIQGIPIPSSYTKDSVAIDTLTEAIDSFILNGNTESGSNVEKIAIENNMITVKGAFPTTLTRTRD